MSPAAQQQLTPSNVTSFRAVQAKRIRALMGSMAENCVALGVELRAVQATFPTRGRGQGHTARPGWAKWLRDECNIGLDASISYINIANKFEHRNITGKLGFTILRALSFSTTPPAAETEILDRVAKGERVKRQEARAIINKHRPSPAKANELARETGRPQLASDGFLYLGASVEAVKESVDRRTAVYAVRRAVATLATITITPSQLIEWALPHQLWTKQEEHEIGAAAVWLRELIRAWSNRK